MDCARAVVTRGRPVKTVSRVLGVSRSQLLLRSRRPTEWRDRRRGPRQRDDTGLVEAVQGIVGELDSYGYRRVTALLNRSRIPRINAKRVYRVMREHQLLLQRHSGRRVDSRAHEGTVAVDHSDRRWCSDTFDIACDNKERVRVVFSLDCCDREAIAWAATTRGIDAELVCDLMVETVEKRCGSAASASSIEWLTDNGSCYVARRAQEFARTIGLVPLTTPIRSPESNGMAESFVKTFKRDYVRRMPRGDARTVMAQLSSAFEHYNEVHPHSALAMKSPRMFRRWRQQTPLPVAA